MQKVTKRNALQKTFQYSFVIVIGILFVVALIRPFTQKTVDSDELKRKEDQAIPTKPDIEKPLHNVDLPDFAAIKDVREKKKAFFAFLRPAIEQENQKLLSLRQQLIEWQGMLAAGDSLSTSEMTSVKSIAKRYKINSKAAPDVLLQRMIDQIDIVPLELVLVQAANESAWGSSRFARIGLNFFGIWCYQKGCGMVPSGRDAGLKHEVAAFDSVNEAVGHYLYNINTNGAYKALRETRRQLRKENLPLDSAIIATGLLAYSERGSDYIIEITEMLRHNARYF